MDDRERAGETNDGKLGAVGGRSSFAVAPTGGVVGV